MITILTGPVDCGKTTGLLSLFYKHRKGDGIAQPKFYISGQYAGQRILRLSTGESVLFALKGSLRPIGWNDQLHYCDYAFCAEGLAFAERACAEMLRNETEPVFIDEIGPLELRKEGLYPFLFPLFSRRKDLYVTVRDSCLEPFLEIFGILHYTLINCGKQPKKTEGT